MDFELGILRMMHDIETRLEGWRYYRLELDEGDIGWPSKNILIALNMGGSSNPPTTGTCLIYKYSDHQQLDSWIMQMGREHPHLEDTLRVYYVSKGHWKIGSVCSLLEISRRTLLQRVHDAKLWLCGRLSAYESQKEKEAYK